MLLGVKTQDRICLSQDESSCVTDFSFFNVVYEAGFFYDGILGLSPDESSNRPSFMSTLKSQGLIDEEVVTFWLNDVYQGIDSQCIFGAGEISNSTMNGPSYDLELDKSNNISSWSVDLNSYSYFNSTFDGPPKAILDTGTAWLILLESDFNVFVNDIIEQSSNLIGCMIDCLAP